MYLNCCKLGLTKRNLRKGGQCIFLVCLGISTFTIFLNRTRWLNKSIWKYCREILANFYSIQFICLENCTLHPVVTRHKIRNLVLRTIKHSFLSCFKFWSKRSACAALGCWHKRRWTLFLVIIPLFSSSSCYRRC